MSARQSLMHQPTDARPSPPQPAGAILSEPLEGRVKSALREFDGWLDRYGETSYDFQTFYAGPLGRRAKGLYYKNKKLGTLAVAPIIFCEAFVPSARRLFFIRQRFPIADAHFAMGFARLFRATGDRRYHERAVHFLEVLLTTACQGRSGLGWGYPFEWVTIDGIIPPQTPLITTLPYVYEAFAAVHEIDGNDRWLSVMRSIAEHARLDYRDFDTGDGAATCSYSTLEDDRGLVVNANAYRAFLLTKAAHDLGDVRYLNAAKANLRFVLKAQNPDGSWYYSTEGKRDFIDHFHTCFVMKALVKIDLLVGDAGCRQAIDAGLGYYMKHLFDESGLPMPFSKAPRLIVYRRELYDYAESLNLLTLVHPRRADAAPAIARVVEDLLGRWRRADGSFRSRQLLIGWDNVPMHRWALAQLFRSLAGLLPGSTSDPSSDERRGRVHLG
jgi:hypothetical protein